MQKKLLSLARGVKPACKRSILAPYEEQIRELRVQKYSYRQIASFLNQVGVKTTWQNVQDFVNRHEKEFKKVKKERDEIKPSFSQKDGIEKAEINSTEKTDKARRDELIQKFLGREKNV